jgi:hypothetical protein
MDDNNLPYFNELSLSKMFECHDWWYEMSDDHRYWKKGIYEQKTINNKIKELGGWNKEIFKLHNKYAPEALRITKEWYNNYLLKQ